jgi:8-oxo-dGTP pyrophosphatase MutT (NUDIX family)
MAILLLLMTMICRNSARGIILKEDAVILIHRLKNKKDYWVFPGGGVKKGESFVQALHRELWEELGITVTILSPLFTLHNQKEHRKQTDHFFLCTYREGTIGSGNGVEFTKRQHKNNQYRIELVESKRIAYLPIVPLKAKRTIMHILKRSS